MQGFGDLKDSFTTNKIRNIMAANNLHFLHSLGQNFIKNPKIISEIVKKSSIDGDTAVLEIGTGLGNLTSLLAATAKKVVTVEIDRNLVSVASQNLLDLKNITIINSDFLKLDLREFWKNHFHGCKTCICANLPYYITSSIIMKILESREKFTTMTIMIQKEVAKKICAPLGTRESSSLTFAINYFCKPEYLFDVAKENFIPVPKVDSAVIKLKRLDFPAIEVFDEKMFFSLIKLSFSKRRKMLRNSLAPFGSVSKEKMISLLEELGVANMRPESLGLVEFSQISNAIYGFLYNH